MVKENGKKQIGMLVEIAVWEEAKRTGIKFPYIFSMGLEAPKLRMRVTEMETQIKILETELNKRGDRLMFLQTEIQRLNEELDALKK